MRRVIFVVVLAVGLVGVAPAAAEPPTRTEERVWAAWPDDDHRFAVLVNTTREDICQPAHVAYEQAVVAWLEGGMVGPPPPPPAPVDGLETVSVLEVTPQPDVVVRRVLAQDVHVELWAIDAPQDRPNVGPCLDTDDRYEQVAVGQGKWVYNDNDFFASGTRTNAWGERLTARMTWTATGETFRYLSVFHISYGCLTGEGPPPCLVQRYGVAPTAE